MLPADGALTLARELAWGGGGGYVGYVPFNLAMSLLFLQGRFGDLWQSQGGFFLCNWALGFHPTLGYPRGSIILTQWVLGITAKPRGEGVLAGSTVSEHFQVVDG